MVASDRRQKTSLSEEPVENRDRVGSAKDSELGCDTDALLRRAKGNHNGGLVLQVLADSLQVSHDGDPVFLQILGGPDTTRHEDLGRSDGSTSQKDLTAGL